MLVEVEKTMGIKKRFKSYRSRLKAFLLLVSMCLSLSMLSSNSYASCPSCVPIQHKITRAHVTSEFEAHEDWMVETFFKDYIQRSLMLMSEQLTVVAMHQMLILGTFFDAKQQLETQRLFHTLEAKAHKDYYPSHEMCTFGTNIRAMSASERKGELVARALAEQSLSRQLLGQGRLSSGGEDYDIEARAEQYRTTYCSVRDNGGGNVNLCDSSVDDERVNKDVDYIRTVDDVLTLDVDFTDSDETEDEEDVIALQNYLFAHKLFPVITAKYLDDGDIANQQEYLDRRSVIAKRSVIENAFNYQVGIRSKGSGGNDSFLRKTLEELGADEDEIKRLDGDEEDYDTDDNSGISYFAQLKTMVQALQSPNFYTRLYDTPANVARMGVALQALELQIDYQMLRSKWRLEMINAIDAELALIKHKEDIESKTVTNLGNTAEASTSSD